jgi:hypothetical protein
MHFSLPDWFSEQRPTALDREVFDDVVPRDLANGIEIGFVERHGKQRVELAEDDAGPAETCAALRASFRSASSARKVAAPRANAS